jgi:hypothetical protein
MTVIESIVTKDKKEKKDTYAFTINGESFEAHHYSGKQSKLEIIHNGTPLGTVDKPKAKSEYVLNEGENAVKITAWIEKGSFMSFTGSSGGIGIEINGKPLQHTVADPEVHIKNGLTGLYFLLIVFVLKCIFTLFTDGGIVGAILYLFPLAIVVVATIKYKSWTKFSIISGFVLAVLEMVEFMVGLIDGMGNAGAVVWIFLRIAAIACLFNALKWQRKVNKKIE